MKKTLVYDLPIRILHWFFAGFFILSFFIVKAFDDDSIQFPYHMLFGMTLSLIVIIRLIWALFGSRYARISSFQFNPIKINANWHGHTLASSWSAMLMYALVLGLGSSGILMSYGIETELIEESHEIMAHLFAIIAILHIVGVLFHSARHKDGLAYSMIHGYKKSIPEEPGIYQSHWGVGIVLTIIILSFLFTLIQNYNSNERSLTFMGLSLSLGETENQNHEHKDHDKHEDHDD